MSYYFCCVKSFGSTLTLYFIQHYRSCLDGLCYVHLQTKGKNGKTHRSCFIFWWFSSNIEYQQWEFRFRVTIVNLLHFITTEDVFKCCMPNRISGFATGNSIQSVYVDLAVYLPLDFPASRPCRVPSAAVTDFKLGGPNYRFLSKSAVETSPSE